MPDQPSRLPPILPPRPSTRPAHRLARVCFWAVGLLFVLGVLYLFNLALTRNSGQVQPSLGGHVKLGLILVICALAALLAVITRRNHLS